MLVFDIVVLILLIVMTFFGFYKGLVMQLASFLALAAGILASYFFWEKSYQILQSWMEMNPYLLKTIAVCGTTIMVTALILIIGKLISKAISITPLGIFDKLLGMIFGIAQMVLFISFIIFALLYINPEMSFLQDDYLSESYLFPYIKPLASNIIRWVF